MYLIYICKYKNKNYIKLIDGMLDIDIDFYINWLV